MKTLRTICTAWALTGLASAGCYQGLEGDRGAPAAEEGGEANGDGAADSAADDGDGDGTPQDSGEPVPEGPFEVPTSEVEALPFHVRIANLAAVAGVTTDHPMLQELWAKRYQLGDHDYAHGVAPNLKWTPEHMEAWVKALRPYCDDPAFQAKFPDLATDPTALVREAFAREPTADELAAYTDVMQGQADGAGRHRMVCLAVLTSLEFVAR